ncbi:Rho GTPase-activating protein gacHH, partial [Geodia barretti]
MEKKLGFGCWEKLQASGSAPSVRFGHSTAVVGDFLYVFGGGSYSDGEETVYHNDLFTLDCEKLMWSCVGQEGDVPTPREGAILVAVSGSLYLYGGTDREGATSCAQGLFLFDTGE